MPDDLDERDWESYVDKYAMWFNMGADGKPVEEGSMLHLIASIGALGEILEGIRESLYRMEDKQNAN